jgi:hypothetical protein
MQSSMTGGEATTMHGYAEARDIDRQIQKLMDADPITRDNALRWLTFAATLEATCKAIKKQASDRLGK